MEGNSDALEFAKRMKYCAGKVGNAAQLARVTGISRRAIGDYLAGDAEPSRPRLISIARAAGVTVEWLATGNGPVSLDGEGHPVDTTANDKTLTLLRYCLEATQELSVELDLGLSDDKVIMLAATLFMAELEERTKGRPPLKPAQVVQIIKRHVA